VGTLARGLKLIVRAEEEAPALKAAARARFQAAANPEEVRAASTAYLKTLTESDLDRIGWEELRLRTHDGENVVDPVQVVDVDGSDNPVFSDAPLNSETVEHVVPRDLQYVEPDYTVDPNDMLRKEMMQGFELRKLTEMAYALYGRTGVEKITELFDPRHRNKAAAIRTFFEGFSGDQCRGALGGTDRDFIEGKSLCWICGFVIPVNATSGYKMECEHVFPIAQAVYFVDLYRGRDVNPDSVNKLYYEYDWSHRVCNQIKNNKHFIRPGPSKEKRWVIAEDAEFGRFLTELYDRSDIYFTGGNQLKAQINTVGRDAWIRARILAVKERCEETLEVGLGGCYPGIFDLIKVAECLNMYDRETEKRQRLNDALAARGRPRARSAQIAFADPVIAPVRRRAATAPPRESVVDPPSPMAAPPILSRFGRKTGRTENPDFIRSVTPKKPLTGTARSRKNGSVVTRSMARRTRRNAKQQATRD
jgi:hypothetical protein